MSDDQSMEIVKSVTNYNPVYIFSRAACETRQTQVDKAAQTEEAKKIEKGNKTEIIMAEVEEIKTVEEQPKEDKNKIHVQLISSFVVTLTLACTGFAVAWPGISIPEITDEKSSLHVTSDQAGWIGSGLPIGGCFGPIASALLLDRIGRKWFLYLTSLPLIVCWILVYLAKSWVYLFVAMFCSGLSAGALFTMVPVYIGELVETRIRGAASVMMMLSLNLGSIITYGIGPMLSAKNLALIGVIPALIFLVTAPWIPESPYYYIKKGKEKSATLALIWLRRKRNANQEIKEMKQLIEDEQHGSIKELFTVPEHRKALLILLLLLAGQQLSGFIAITNYSMILLSELKLSLNNFHILLVIYTLSLMSSFLSMYTVDRLGRKPVFLIASYTTSLCLFTAGALFLLKTFKISLGSLSNWIPLAAFVIFFIAFAFGLASIPSIVSSEIFPINMKTWATMIANVYGSVLGLVAMKSYQLVTDAFGVHVILLAFGLIELIVSIIASIYMKETSRKSFAEIQAMLKGETVEVAKE